MEKRNAAMQLQNPLQQQQGRSKQAKSVSEDQSAIKLLAREVGRQEAGKVTKNKKVAFLIKQMGSMCMQVDRKH